MNVSPDGPVKRFRRLARMNGLSWILRRHRFELRRRHLISCAFGTGPAYPKIGETVRSRQARRLVYQADWTSFVTIQRSFDHRTIAIQTMQEGTGIGDRAKPNDGDDACEGWRGFG